jgi:hypothetical protein
MLAKFSRAGDASGSGAKAISLVFSAQLEPSQLSKRRSNRRLPPIGRNATIWLQSPVSTTSSMAKGPRTHLTVGKYTWIERSFEERKPVEKAAAKEEVIIPDSKLAPAIQVFTPSNQR